MNTERRYQVFEGRDWDIITALSVDSVDPTLTLIKTLKVRSSVK